LRKARGGEKRGEKATRKAEGKHLALCLSGDSMREKRKKKGREVKKQTGWGRQTAGKIRSNFLHELTRWCKDHNIRGIVEDSGKGRGEGARQEKNNNTKLKYPD